MYIRKAQQQSHTSDQLKAAAKENNRSLNAEIISRLELTFDNENLSFTGSDYLAIKAAAKKANRTFREEFKVRLTDSFVPTSKAEKDLVDQTKDLYGEIWELRKTVRGVNKFLMDSMHTLNKRVRDMEGIPVEKPSPTDNETDVKPKRKPREK